MLGTEPQQGLIPAMTNENGGGRIVDMLYSGLVYYDAEGNVHNEMAESIDKEGDKTCKATLKPDLKLSDGSVVTADTFVDTWNYAVANEQFNKSFFSSIKGYGEGVKEMEGLKIIDERTFTIELTQSESDFPSRLGYNAYFPVPAAALEDPQAFGETPVSNGPYTIKEWNHNQNLVIEPNPEYKGDRAAQDDGIEFTSPVLNGYNDSLPGLENVDYNPEEAKKLWAEADKKYGAFEGTFPINYNTDGDNKDWADAAANNISNTLGIQAVGNPYPDFKSFRDAYRTERMDGAYRTAWFADYPSMGNFLGPNFTTGVASNDSKYSNPEFDELIVKANGAANEEEAAKLYNQAQELLLRDLPSIPLFYPNVVGGWSENVDDVTFNWKSLPVYYAVKKN